MSLLHVHMLRGGVGEFILHCSPGIFQAFPASVVLPLPSRSFRFPALFPLTVQVVVHERIHTNEKRFACSYSGCPYAAVRRWQVGPRAGPSNNVVGLVLWTFFRRQSFTPMTLAVIIFVVPPTFNDLACVHSCCR